MPDVEQMPQYELLTLFKDVVHEILAREKAAGYNDKANMLMGHISEVFGEYEKLNDAREC